MWIEDAALECWQTCGPGGQARYTDAAIQTSLMLRTAFKLPLRRTEGLMTSVLTLMDLTISYQTPYPLTAMAQVRCVMEARRPGMCISLVHASQQAPTMAS